MDGPSLHTCSIGTAMCTYVFEYMLSASSSSFSVLIELRALISGMRKCTYYVYIYIPSMQQEHITKIRVTTLPV